MQKTSKRLRNFREAACMTIEDVARELNLKPQAVIHWENGDWMPNVANLFQLAQLYEVTMDELVASERSIA